MSYYTMAMEFWGAMGLGMGTLPLVAASAQRVACAFGRSSVPIEAPQMPARRTASAHCPLFG